MTALPPSRSESTQATWPTPVETTQTAIAPGAGTWFTTTPGSPATLAIHWLAFPRPVNSAAGTPERDSRHATYDVQLRYS
jgi:hypothetical protein